MLGLKGFVAATLGGLGSGVGAVAGGIALGLMESLTAGYVSSAYKDAAAFVVVLLILARSPARPVRRGDRGAGSERAMTRHRSSAHARRSLARAVAAGRLRRWRSRRCRSLLPNAYYVDVAIRVAINATVAIALNLLIGYTGQISLGHAAFFGLGAYGSAILCCALDWPPLAALAASAAAIGVLAYGLARVILRLEGHYLAMATLGVGVIATIALTNETELTGGPDGMPAPDFTDPRLGDLRREAWCWLFAGDPGRGARGSPAISSTARRAGRCGRSRVRRRPRGRSASTRPRSRRASSRSRRSRPPSWARSTPTTSASSRRASPHSRNRSSS